MQQDKSELYLSIMNLNDMFQTLSESSKQIEKLRFEDLTPEIWAGIVASQRPIQMLFDTMIAFVPNATKIVANDAVSAHIEAVTSAD